MSNSDSYIPFSQRAGYSEVPPQLKLGEVSKELRRLLDYAMHQEVRRVERTGYDDSYFVDDWRTVSMDFHVRFLRQPVRTYNNSSFKFRSVVEEGIQKLPIGPLFDLVEFFARHKDTSTQLELDLAEAFVQARAAYRLVNGMVIAVGNEQQGEAVEAALTATEQYGAKAARGHLVRAGSAIRAGDWAGSVRESIHAVEAVARKLDANASTLGPALAELEKRGHLHPALKAAFSKLYGYTNDEAGLRHANVFEDSANVDETDALFMLGACASFVSYLLARSNS